MKTCLFCLYKGVDIHVYNVVPVWRVDIHIFFQRFSTWLSTGFSTVSRCSLCAVAFVPVLMVFSALFSVCGVALSRFWCCFMRFSCCDMPSFALQQVAFCIAICGFSCAERCAFGLLINGVYFVDKFCNGLRLTSL